MPQPDATVFVVDDDASIRQALAGLIRSAGLKVETFASAQEFMASSWLLSGTAPILLKGPLLLILCPDARRSRGVGDAAVPFAHIAYCRERASPTATGGCEESAAAQAGDVHGLAALDDRAPDEVDGFVADDGDAGAAGHCASVAPRGLPPSVAMVVTTSRPKADTLRDADPRDGGAKPKVGR